jgi:predicted AAA+ superfamily ATPase
MIPRHISPYILKYATGSSQFLLIEKITQSLAGRIVNFKLYPLSFLELMEYPGDESFDSVFRIRHKNRKKIEMEELYNLLFTGFYPRIHDKHLDSYKWYENYLLNYVERDVRALLNVRNLRTFENFLKLCASQSAQLMNYSNLANSLGISVSTVKEWVSILEASGLIFILPPYFENFSKRIVKTPKIYFADCGLLSHLLSIRNVEQLKSHPLRGSIFETFIVSDCFKRFYNLGEKPPLYFWRDQSGNEIDLLIYNSLKGFPIEIKLSQSFHPDFMKSINQWLTLKNNPAQEGSILYCGAHSLQINAPVSAAPWYVI